MKYTGMPQGMWLIFHRSFRKQLVRVLGLTKAQARTVEHSSKARYREIISTVPVFEKNDRFKMNLVNCAMLCAFLLSLPERPDVAQTTVFYREAMMTRLMRLFCRLSGKNKFTPRDIAGMQAAAALRAADRNPYSWNMDFIPYADEEGYEARFTRCGICTLTRELGLYDLTPALCQLDYTMSEAGGASVFVRQYTLASGGPYCDCGYRRKKADPS